MNNVLKEHLLNLLRWLNREVMSAGGDGDAIWYSKYRSLEEILPLVEELNNTEWDSWWTIELNPSYILLHNHQESLMITTDLDYEIPSWSQCTLYY